MTGQLCQSCDQATHSADTYCERCRELSAEERLLIAIWAGREIARAAQ